MVGNSIFVFTLMGRSRPARSQLYQAGRGHIAPAPAGDTPTPLQTLYAPSVVRRARAPQSAPAGHRPTGPGQSRHPPRVHRPGRRYPSIRVRSQSKQRSTRLTGVQGPATSAGSTSMCTTGPARARCKATYWQLRPDSLTPGHCFRVAGPLPEPSILWRSDGGTSFESKLGRCGGFTSGVASSVPG